MNRLQQFRADNDLARAVRQVIAVGRTPRADDRLETPDPGADALALLTPRVSGLGPDYLATIETFGHWTLQSRRARNEQLPLIPDYRVEDHDQLVSQLLYGSGDQRGAREALIVNLARIAIVRAPGDFAAELAARLLDGGVLTADKPGARAAFVIAQTMAGKSLPSLKATVLHRASGAAEVKGAASSLPQPIERRAPRRRS